VSTPARLGGFVALLVLIFAGAAFAGARLDPDVDEPAGEMAEMTGDAGHAADRGQAGGGGHTGDAPDAGHTGGRGHAGESHGEAGVPGLAAAAGGYRLLVRENTIEPGAGSRYSFSVVGEDGQVVDEFDKRHERRMHLIVVRRDFRGFRHLHPRQGPDGSWTVKLKRPLPGVHRVFADFSARNRPVTLATDLFVPGRFRPRPMPPAEPTADAGDGYEVTLEAPPAHAGEMVETGFVVTRDGEPVDGVDPYLGADGHLVALREGDQAYLHTHPEGEPGGDGPIRFGVTYPTVGRYRLYFQFRHDGQVRTTEFTRTASAAHHEGDETGGH
jgi:hypothetical protein